MNVMFSDGEKLSPSATSLCGTSRPTALRGDTSDECASFRSDTGVVMDDGCQGWGVKINFSGLTEIGKGRWDSNWTGGIGPVLSLSQLPENIF